jgi:hypothetical protein
MTHDLITTMYETYVTENDKFMNSGNKAAGTRARKALAEIGKLIKVRRKEIQDIKNADK